jgi:prephenate dehydrogenase
VSDPVVQRLAIVGLGLLGGSVGLAARVRGVAREIVGAGRSAESQAAALRAGAVDALVSGSDALRGADLVVLATPVSAMAPVLTRLAPALAPGALVTDVGSVKGPLADVLPGLLPEGVSYVGAHPMAGSHERGAEHARADLFEGAACVLTPTRDSDPRAAARAEAFWRALGCRVVRREPAAHDAEVAWVSHAPHVLAFAFARALEAASPTAREIAGPGFRDFTRIARSDAELWSEILAANRKAIAGPLQKTARRLEEIAQILERGSESELERFIAAARAALVAEKNED